MYYNEITTAEVIHTLHKPNLILLCRQSACVVCIKPGT